MKRMMAIFICFVLIFVCFSGCGNKNLISDGDAEPTLYVTNINGYIVQPENAMQQLINGMPLCYLDYVVENPDYYPAMTRAVIPVVIQSPGDFESFFSGEDDLNRLAEPVQDELFKTDAGKAIYTDPAFYETWNLMILSVRESNHNTKHTIDSVTYNSDSCIVTVNGTRDIAEGEGNATVLHYVFRLPANVYMGVNNSFKEAD